MICSECKRPLAGDFEAFGPLDYPVCLGCWLAWPKWIDGHAGLSFLPPYSRIEILAERVFEDPNYLYGYTWEEAHEIGPEGLG